MRLKLTFFYNSESQLITALLNTASSEVFFKKFRMTFFTPTDSRRYSSRRKAGTRTARAAGASEASSPIPSTVNVTGRKSQARMEIG